ncbi:hypothetical protein J6590_076245 [Homalodisca vitripennis]|nr:hypothetical protein J6590_076245 [Homalodisca vitripennis]
MDCQIGAGMECYSHKYKFESILEAFFANSRLLYKCICDPIFQAEYLQHKSCIKVIIKDWNDCISQFYSLITNSNFSMDSTLPKQCSARDGFLKCVYDASTLKCEKEGALFIKKFADNLSNLWMNAEKCAQHCTIADTEETSRRYKDRFKSTAVE